MRVANHEYAIAVCYVMLTSDIWLSCSTFLCSGPDLEGGPGPQSSH